MFLRIEKPSIELQQFIKSIIYYENYTGSKNYEKLLPDTNSQLIIELDGNSRTVKNKQADDFVFQNSWISGVQTKPVVYKSEKKARTIVIQFKECGLYRLTGIPSSEFKDYFVESTLVFGSTIINLRELLLEQKNVDSLFKILNKFMIKKINTYAFDPNIIQFFKMSLLERAQSLKEFTKSLGLSQKHFIDLFKKNVGLAPKSYQRLCRFNKTLTILNSELNKDFSDLAYLCNYYDQPHFINEFKGFTGYSPYQYLSVNRDYPHVISLDNY